MADPVQLPPQALEAEMAVLGSMLIERDAVEKASDILNERDFYRDNHRRVFMAMSELYRRGQAVDLVTVGAELTRMKELENIGGMEALSELIHKVSTAAHVEYYARIVKEKSLLRQLIATATEVVSSCYSEQKEAAHLLDEAQAKIMRVAESQGVQNVVEVKNLVHEVVERMEIAHREKQSVTGVPTGLHRLDRVTAGFQRSDLIILAARPGQGKTALALNIASNAVLAQKPNAVLFFSLEMDRHAIMQRIIASEAQVNLKDIRTGYFRRDAWPNLTNAAARIQEAPLFIVDTPGLSVLTVRSITRQLAADLKRKGKNLGMIVVDYLQLLRGSSSRPESRQQEVSEISRGLKFLARDVNIPVLALSQLSRRTEEKGRGDERPRLSDLRESGALEQDADMVLFIYRESYYKPNDPTLEGKADIIVAKNRQGPTDSVTVAFLREFTKFGNEATDGGGDSDFVESQASLTDG